MGKFRPGEGRRTVRGDLALYELSVSLHPLIVCGSGDTLGYTFDGLLTAKSVVNDAMGGDVHGIQPIFPCSIRPPTARVPMWRDDPDAELSRRRALNPLPRLPPTPREDECAPRDVMFWCTPRTS